MPASDHSGACVAGDPVVLGCDCDDDDDGDAGEVDVVEEEVGLAVTSVVGFVADAGVHEFGGAFVGGLCHSAQKYAMDDYERG